jgi:hypothetical protein
VCSQRTLNYELSLPTKLSEYLHGGVPVVGSDVRAVSAFLRQHDVGEVFTADDPVSFADAVRRAMARRAELAANISESVLGEFCWEHQTEGLLQLYREIAPIAPTRPGISRSWDVNERSAAAAALDDAPAPLTPWRPLDPEAPVRLALGCANYAGQLAAFAQAICAADEGVTAEVTMRRMPTSFDYPADVYLDPEQLADLDVQLARARRILGDCTHVIADAFLPVFGQLNGSNIGADLPALRRARIKVALLAHGSEVRNPQRHLRRYDNSLFHAADPATITRLTRVTAANRRLAEECGLPVFVTTPDLLDDLPSATWAPLVVDVDQWHSDRPVMDRRRPVVVHAPSARWTKGTGRVLPVLTEMHERGAIELRLVEMMPPAQLRDLIRDCDIVLDQFAIGTYGTLAVEAMAAGRPVIGFVDPAVHQAVGVTPPIVNARAEELRDALESLIDDAALAVRTGAASAAFARELHDGRRTAAAFATFLS